MAKYRRYFFILNMIIGAYKNIRKQGGKNEQGNGLGAGVAAAMAKRKAKRLTNTRTAILPQDCNVSSSSAPGKFHKQAPARDSGLQNPADQHLCPVCAGVLGLARWSSAGTEFGCRRCGNWFLSDVMRGEESQAPRAESAPVPRFSPNSIILPLQSATLMGAVEELVPRALQGAEDISLRSAKVVECLQKGLHLRSVEYHQGLAFLHHRFREARGQRMALGISSIGLRPEKGVGNRIFVVALFLRPLGAPGYDIPLWARKSLCSDKMIGQLRTIPNVATALELLGTP